MGWIIRGMIVAEAELGRVFWGGFEGEYASWGKWILIFIFVFISHLTVH